MKQLILTADDFGMAQCVNEAVIEAHTAGVLTSASLMVNGMAFDDAVHRARATPTLAVGLHLTLAQGKSTLPREQIPDLTDATGYFPNQPVGAGLRYFFRRGLRSQIEAEVRAQIEKFLATGLALDHLDGHMNIHMHPTILALLLNLSGEYGIRALRVPDEPWFPSLLWNGPGVAGKTFHAAAFRPLGARAKTRLRVQGLRCANRVYGLLESGHMNEAYLMGLLQELPDGLTEIYFHAAKSPCAEFRRWNPSYRAEEELQALTSERVREFLRSSNIERVCYSKANGD